MNRMAKHCYEACVQRAREEWRLYMSIWSHERLLGAFSRGVGELQIATWHPFSLGPLQSAL